MYLIENIRPCERWVAKQSKLLFFAFADIPHFDMYQKFENCDLSHKSDQLWGAFTLFHLGRDNFYHRDSVSHDMTFITSA